MALDHLMLSVKAFNLAAPPRTAEEMERWLTRVVRAVRMQVLIPAKAARCDDAGNEGVTGLVGITTSHAAIHVWDGVSEPWLAFHLYSCAPFGSGEVVRLIQEFGPRGRAEDHAEGYQPGVAWELFDYRGLHFDLIERGEIGHPKPPGLAPHAGFVA